MKDKIISGLIVAILLLPSVYAQETILSGFTWENSCQDNVTLLKEISFDLDGTVSTLNQTVPCPNGCEENLGKYGADCVEPEYVITLWVFAGFAVIIFIVLLILGRRR